ncbi:hypothetical protein BO85DRAFT_10011 [Aspergillus piperis CBS 112811]|uniref:Uncharacterized protein n=1 Tax=Aspergillus piperis CBS 112811 TaxID=1448313 RepID=A0A8G1VSE9_9EURO|nr:hypothetical protein BO85DRAFT_10011 [Aspergillus piperis CBS 112811]RAH62870.1 hypothetical protein BO85DRAFT_10011 [Aspergillus piperis CBS 112811]
MSDCIILVEFSSVEFSSVFGFGFFITWMIVLKIRLRVGAAARLSEPDSLGGSREESLGVFVGRGGHFSGWIDYGALFSSRAINFHYCSMVSIMRSLVSPTC